MSFLLAPKPILLQISSVLSQINVLVFFFFNFCKDLEPLVRKIYGKIVSSWITRKYKLELKVWPGLGGR